MRLTAAEALGNEDAVVVREVEVPSDGEALRIERAVPSQTVAQVAWLDPAHTRARVRVHAAETGRWTERTIVFSSVDTSVERGRALGFAVTSMLPEETLAANLHRRAEGPPVLSRTPDGDYGTSLRLALVGTLGLGGNATGLGGAVAGEFYVTPTWLVRLSFSARQGDVALRNETAAQSATDLAGYVGLGVAYWPMRRSPGRALTLGVRVDALVLFHSVKGPRLEGDPAFAMERMVIVRRNKVLPGLGAMGEVAWNVLGPVEMVASLGLEIAAGNTPLELNGKPTEKKIPILRAVGEAGIRLSF
jgi:hypothetical protein